jgi:hypothetical protein
MRLTHKLCVPGLLVASAVTFSAASALAQTPPPAEPAAPAAAPAPAPAPAPATPPPAAPAAAADATPAAAAPAAPPAEEVFPAAWTRIDSDFLGLQLWAGATHPLSDTVGIATDIYLNAPLAGVKGPVTFGEFDIGPAFTAGKFTITPMLGGQWDLWNHRMNSLVPQLYITGGGGDPIYMELWVQNYENQVFSKTYGTNNLYFRYFIDFTLGKYMALGPEAELLLGLNKNGKAPGGYAPDLGGLDDKGEGKGVVALPVGLNFNFTNYGKNNNLMIFAGYETTKTPSDAHLAGRLTFIHNF